VLTIKTVSRRRYLSKVGLQPHAKHNITRSCNRNCALRAISYSGDKLARACCEPTAHGRHGSAANLQDHRLALNELRPPCNGILRKGLARSRKPKAYKRSSIVFLVGILCWGRGCRRQPEHVGNGERPAHLLPHKVDLAQRSLVELHR